MASLSFPPLLTLPVASPLQVGAVVAATPVALLQAELDALPLPAPQAASVLPQAAGSDALDNAAMRPDQLMMARQLTWPAPDGGALASAWRGMVRNYGNQLAARELQLRTGLVPSALLQAGQPGGQVLAALRQPALEAGPLDAWRFTVHAGGPQARHLRVVEGEPEQQQQRRQRRRARAALRLELVLEDGSTATLQAEPSAAGIALEVCASSPRTLARLRELEPQLEAAVRRAGLRILSWSWREAPGEGRAHARLPSSEAAAALGLPVFRAMAELALTLPA